MRPEPRTDHPSGAPPPSPKAALLAWKDAEDKAWEAERCLYAAWHAYRSSGRLVPALLQERATAARALARRMLDEAIAAGKAAADRPCVAATTTQRCLP